MVTFLDAGETLHNKPPKPASPERQAAGVAADKKAVRPGTRLEADPLKAINKRCTQVMSMPKTITVPVQDSEGIAQYSVEALEGALKPSNLWCTSDVCDLL